MKLDPFRIPYIKVKDLNVRAKTVKLLEENRCGLELGSDFLDMTSEAQAIKGKQFDFIKTKNLCTSKDTYQESEKITYRMRENICKSYIRISDFCPEHIKNTNCIKKYTSVYLVKYIYIIM